MLYYYLISSFPELNIDEPPGVTLEQFLFNCQGILDVKDLNDLNKVLAGDATGVQSPGAVQWLAADAQLRNAVARLRAAHLNIDAIAYLKDHEGARMYIETVVRDAFTRDNPQERELALDKCRWSILDEIAFEDRFGFGAVLAFGVKLQIVERWQGYSKDKGREEFDKFVFRNLEAQGFPAVIENSA